MEEGALDDRRDRPWSGYAIAAGVLGVVQLVVGLPATIGALVTGHKALRDIKRAPEPVKGRRVALASVSFSYLFAVLFTVGAIVYLTKDDPPTATPYPASARAEYMRHCNITPRSVCACQFRALRKRVSYERFQELVADGRAWMDPLDLGKSDPIDESLEVLAAVGACL